MLSGLLLHLCPPPGQFADLFGVEESLRSRVIGMLGARDLATFGLVRKEGRGRGRGVRSSCRVRVVFLLEKRAAGDYLVHYVSPILAF